MCVYHFVRTSTFFSCTQNFTTIWWWWRLRRQKTATVVLWQFIHWFCAYNSKRSNESWQKKKGENLVECGQKMLRLQFLICEPVELNESTSPSSSIFYIKEMCKCADRCFKRYTHTYAFTFLPFSSCKMSTKQLWFCQLVTRWPKLLV